jgi:alkylation response protein AidB-like acyl-CoA dehydrogenase
VEACERSRNVREWARQSQLAPGIEAGRRFLALAEKHVGDFWDLASGYDREGSFPVENFADLTASRAIAATVPAEVGGRTGAHLPLRHDLELLDSVREAQVC